MKAGAFAIVIILIILISGCISQQSNFQQPALGNEQPRTQNSGLETQNPQDTGPKTQDQQQPAFGCDGVCDNFEKQVKEQSSCYKSDCLGIKENISQQSQQPQQQFNLPPQENNEITVMKTNSTYKTVDAGVKLTGWFSSGQEADIMLSGIGFNDTGGSLLFNHPGTIATDGTHLLLADRNNNRILIWNKLPKGNEPPDMVLGQKDFISNNPGEGIDELDWPVAVAASTDGKVIVSDTYNDRILIWNKFPTKNGQAADIIIQDMRKTYSTPGTQNSKRNIGWPWAVWTDGKKLIVTSTATSSVLIWNAFPTQNDQPADIVLYANKTFGTPRSIGSDGTNLMIGDHNAKLFTGSSGGGRGTFFWKTFPTEDDQPYDFALKSVWEGHKDVGEELWAAVTLQDGRFAAVGESLYIWDKFPESENDKPSLMSDYMFRSNSGSGIAIANGTLYISSTNGNRIWGYNSVPSTAQQKPDFAIGSDGVDADPLADNYFMTNPVPLTDGESLIAISDFDRKMYVWKNIPDESGAKPDFVYSNLGGPWDGAIFNGVLAVGGRQDIYIWKKVPLNGEKPDTTIKEKIGSIQFNEIRGIAIDEKYFYVADNKANKIYVWSGIPTSDATPIVTISTDQPFRLSSDGKYLAVVKTYGPNVEIYKISELETLNSKPYIVGGQGTFNLPEGVLVYNGSLFVADTVFNRVHVWKNVEDAIAGKDADVILGETDTAKLNHPEIGKNKLFWPAGLAFDGSYLWVGEFKFSGRLMRFSVQ